MGLTCQLTVRGRELAGLRRNKRILKAAPTGIASLGTGSATDRASTCCSTCNVCGCCACSQTAGSSPAPKGTNVANVNIEVHKAEHGNLVGGFFVSSLCRFAKSTGALTTGRHSTGSTWNLGRLALSSPLPSHTFERACRNPTTTLPNASDTSTFGGCGCRVLFDKSQR